MRLSQRIREEIVDEYIARMSEPEPYRSLRLQKERLEAERQRAAEQASYDSEAEQLRRDIRALGETPCA